MRARRRPAVSEGDEGAWSESYDPPPDIPFDDEPATSPPARSTRARDAGPLRVCLGCGESPQGRECPHDEVATVPSPGATLRDAAALLARLTQERRAAERALRRLVDAAVLEGEASLEAREAPRAPAPPPVVILAPTPTAPRPRRRRDDDGAQRYFAFAAPPEPAPTQPPPPAPSEAAPVDAPRRPRRRAASDFPAR